MIHRRKLILLAAASLLLFQATLAHAAEQVLEPGLHHLRAAGPREWSEFPETPESDHLEIRFAARGNQAEQALRLRQQDVKQTWRILLNGAELGRLHADEDDMVVYFPVPPGALKTGENILRIEQDLSRRAPPDDIRVGEIVLNDRTIQAVLAESHLEIEVTDQDTGKPTPSRITVLNSGSALQTFDPPSHGGLAVRPGVAYTLSGSARLSLPAGEYTVYAGRGFEYSLAKAPLRLKPGETGRLALSIRREVPTEGWVSSDTHIHTFTYSHHGDASIEERMVTLAGEGIELPIATDHGAHIDYDKPARDLGARQYFTPVIGSEVTTPSGHFNVFRVQAGAQPSDASSADWAKTFEGIYRTPVVKAVILNHARDLHGKIRPFDPAHFNAASAESLEGWPMGFNAMEVVNSGAVETAYMQLFRDWMALLNRGYAVTPVGSSDSHDVGRHFVGQGRTYIRLDDRDVSALDAGQAVENFVRGRVHVSYGLLAEMTVNGKYGPGELAKIPGDEVKVAARVLGPHWTSADHIALYANGSLIREQSIDTSARNSLPRGVIWTGEWSIPKPRHDMYLVAIATGPGIDVLYWKTAKPYQPTSPDWQPRVIGCSGAVWVDADGDGRPTPAYDYARLLFAGSAGDSEALIGRLSNYDRAVAVQVAQMIQSKLGPSWWDQLQTHLQSAAPAVKAGFEEFHQAWLESQSARSSH